MSLETKSVENGRFLGVKANDPERRSVHKMKADDLGENRRFLGQSRRSRLKWTISRVKSRWSRGIKRTILSEIWLFESRWSFESKRTILLEILSVGEPPILKDKCFRSYRLGSSALIHKIEKKIVCFYSKIFDQDLLLWPRIVFFQTKRCWFGSSSFTYKNYCKTIVCLKSKLRILV